MISSFVNSKSAAPIESANCSTLFAPTIGAVMNGWASCQARATRVAVELCRCAISISRSDAFRQGLISAIFAGQESAGERAVRQHADPVPQTDLGKFPFKARSDRRYQTVFGLNRDK